jgi:Zn-dependent peptidase ImmA (M78 family)
MITKSITELLPEAKIDTNVFIFNDSEYNEFLDRYNINNVDPRGMAICHPINLIILNIDNIENDDILNIIIAHEYGHIVVGENEEDADKFALTLLAEEHKTLLKENWNIRHGHDYCG